MSGAVASKPQIEVAVGALLRYFPLNPHKHGLITELYKDGAGEWQKDVVTNEGQPVTLELVRAHLEGKIRLVKHGLGYLSGTATGTSVGMIDIDKKNYPEADTSDHEAVTLEDARRKVLDVCEALGLFAYCEESTRGGWHIFVFFTSLFPYATVRKALKAIVARAGLAASTEVYPNGDSATGRWVIMPYYGAATSADSLGRTFLQTADGEAIRFDELDEWIRPSDAGIIATLAEEFSEDDAAREGWTEPDDLAPEAVELLIEAAKNPDLTKLTDRHGSIVAFLNLANRAGRKAEMVKALKEEVRERWIKDGSRDPRTWNSEVDRWAKESKSARKRGITFLLEQGFKIPDLPKTETKEKVEKHQRKSQATVLVELAEAQGVELFHDPEQEPYASVMVGGHREVYRLRSKAFRSWLQRAHYEETGHSVGAQGVQDALGPSRASASLRVRRCPSTCAWLSTTARSTWTSPTIAGRWWIEPPRVFRRRDCLSQHAG